MIKQPATVVTLKPGPELTVTPSNFAADVSGCLNALRLPSLLGRFAVVQSAPEHSGLGSQTQLRLAIASAAAIATSSKYAMNELPAVVGRGGTSGVGSWGFWYGGLIADGGHDRKEKMFLPSSAVDRPSVAPLMHRTSFPWPIVMATCSAIERVSGTEEVRLFRQLTPVPYSEVTEAYALVYGEAIPAVIRHDLESFGSAVCRLRQIGFKRREIEARDSRVPKIIGLMDELGLYGATMSSWGPVCVAFTESVEAAADAVQALEATEEVSNAWWSLPDNVGATWSMDCGEARPVRDEIAVGKP